MKNPSSRILWAAVFLAVVLLAGVAGYRWIEGWGFFDSLYMTVITLATVGYGETHPLSPSGRLFTIFLILLGVGALTYAVTAVTTFVVEGALTDVLGRRRMEAEIARLKEHLILCGGGETGRHVAEEFHKVGAPFVVIDRDAGRLEHLKRTGHTLFIEGDASSEEVLAKAGIGQARGLVAALPQDKDNIFVILTAREMNPRLRIVSRVVEQESRPKLLKAGADAAVSASFIGGLRMASEMVRPAVVSFLDQMLRSGKDAVRVHEVKMGSSCRLVGRTLAEAAIYDKTGLLVVAVARNGGYEINPSPQTRLQEGDGLIVCCSSDQLKRLNTLVVS